MLWVSDGEKTPSPTAIGAVLFGILAGARSGLVSGQYRRVWRDGVIRHIMQQDDWKHILILLTFVAVRGAVRVVASHLRGLDEQALNVAFIAAIVGNFLWCYPRAKRKAGPTLAPSHACVERGF